MSNTQSNFRGRREDLRLVTGHGHFSNDWNLPGQVHCAGVRLFDMPATPARIWSALAAIKRSN